MVLSLPHSALCGFPDNGNSDLAKCAKSAAGGGFGDCAVCKTAARIGGGGGGGHQT